MHTCTCVHSIVRIHVVKHYLRVHPFSDILSTTLFSLSFSSISSTTTTLLNPLLYPAYHANGTVFGWPILFSFPFPPYFNHPYLSTRSFYFFIRRRCSGPLSPTIISDSVPIFFPYLPFRLLYFLKYAYHSSAYFSFLPHSCPPFFSFLTNVSIFSFPFDLSTTGRRFG